MDQGDHQELKDRIERLEALLFDLSRRIEQREHSTVDPSLNVEEHDPPLSPEDLTPAIASSPPSHLITFDDEPISPLSHPLITLDEEHHPEKPDSVRSGKEVHNSELWLNRIGVILLLLGLGFLFKYSIDRDWITPAVRVAFGIALGIGLITFGFRVQENRRMQSHFLMGGGVVAFYISGYAGFQLYHLVPQYLALLFMTGTSLLAFYLAIRQSVPALSLVAVLGGLGTPFLLNTGSGYIPGLILYACLVLAAGMAIFYFRPWRSLLWSSWAGGWLVMGIAIDRLTYSDLIPAFYYQSAQAGVLFVSILYWIVPLLQKGSDWNPTVPAPDSTGNTPVFENLVADRNSPVASVVLLSPLITFIFSKSIWNLPDAQWGIILISGASLYTLAGLTLWQLKARGETVALHTSVATLLLTLSLYYLLDDDFLFLACALEAALLNLAGTRLRHPAIRYAGALLFAGVGLWFVARMFETPSADPLFNRDAAIHGSVILLAAFSSTQASGPTGSRAYGLYAYLGFLALILKEVSHLTNGDGLVSIVWGISGGLALWTGLRKKHLDMFKTGFFTLILVAAKLLIIDLSHLEVIWRILIFLGFGAAFLLISYWMKDQWQPEPKGLTQPPTA